MSYGICDVDFSGYLGSLTRQQHRHRSRAWLREYAVPWQLLYNVLSIMVLCRENRIAPGLNDPVGYGQHSEKLKEAEEGYERPCLALPLAVSVNLGVRGSRFCSKTCQLLVDDRASNFIFLNLYILPRSKESHPLGPL